LQGPARLWLAEAAGATANRENQSVSRIHQLINRTGHTKPTLVVDFQLFTFSETAQASGPARALSAAPYKYLEAEDAEPVADEKA
jgi:hypothetical protein